MEHYFLIKHLHMTFAGLSIVFFIVRAWWSVRESPHLQRRWVRIAPHIIDTGLLGLGIALMIMLSFWPHQHPWLAAKLLGLVLYILLGTIAIKRGRSPAGRAVAAILAVLVFVYIIGAAIRHHPLSWLA
ncbi:SirB2 family protein [Litchfieldella xinjiangensis]|uniref:SirB2 family protein n=1 Tax=Litchfieldella xinjiangensis TaxID=1166948 RepID=UPI0005B93FF7|nr:SirB2 family protein [Halomonas xinjiangensis]